MPVTPTYPGVYVQEVPSGVRTITGVATSIGMFVGRTRRGPIGRPVLCLNYTDFVRNFSDDTSAGQLPYYVKLFFLNGGTQCYVMRIANGAASSSVDLQNENTNPVLRLTAKAAGVDGENIRAIVSYDGPQSEVTFNIDLFRWDLEGGKRVKKDAESWKNLSMNPDLPTYAPSFLSQNSKLVDASDLDAALALAGNGFSQSGRAVNIPAPAGGTEFQTAWAGLVGNASLGGINAFQISVDGSPFVPVTLSNIDVNGMNAATVQADLESAVENTIQTTFANAGFPGVAVDVTFEPGPAPLAPLTGTTTLLRITSTTGSDIFIRTAAQNDLAVPLMLGTEQGGLEVGAHVNRRPAPNGISLRASNGTTLNDFGSLQQNAINQITLEETIAGGGLTPHNVALNLITSGATDNIYIDAFVGSPNGNSNGVREKLALIAAAINAEAAADPDFPWTATVAGNRLNLQPGGSTDDNMISGVLATAPTNFVTPAHFTMNAKHYTLGAGGLNVGFQTAGTTGSDGVAPISTDYDDAYLVIDREVDLFNLMILPPNADSLITPQGLYGNASVFCQQRRAFLIMDPPDIWTDVQSAINAATGVNSLRIGLVKDYAALYFPKITLNDRGRNVNIGAAGAIAGLMARIDGTRGVWKAPAGTEADLRGVVGLERKLSDSQNGVINQRGINALRVFPNGIVSWGGRTMDGDDNFGSEYKYVPIRRLALFIEESLYRGLKWVVFEPNDEPLWSQIRLNVGAFMQNLFRQGAFQGATPREAYFVKCDAETTTQNDRNLGIVNIMVGFAPLKPAEFVILYLQQMAGQIEV